MRRSILFISILSGVLVAASSATVSADNSMTASGGSMGDHMAFLIGTWNCGVKLPAMNGDRGSTTRSIFTYTRSPDNTIREHIASAIYEGDEYYGYDMKTKTHWTSGADTQGAVVWETSKDGVVFTGTSVVDGVSTPERDTFTHSGNTAIRDVTQDKTNGKWVTIIDSSCTKQ